MKQEDRHEAMPLIHESFMTNESVTLLKVLKVVDTTPTPYHPKAGPRLEC